MTSENIRNWKRKEEITILGDGNRLNLRLLTVRPAMSYMQSTIVKLLASVMIVLR